MKVNVEFKGGPLDGSAAIDYIPGMMAEQTGLAPGSPEFMAWSAFDSAMRWAEGRIGAQYTGMTPASYVERYVKGNVEKKPQACCYVLTERQEKDGELFVTFIPREELRIGQVGDPEEVRRQLGGKHVVIVYRKGGRITEEHRYDSESGVSADLQAIGNTLMFIANDKPLGIDLIGKGYVGFLPWEKIPAGGKPSKAEIVEKNCPVRVADVVENNATGITTIYLESV